MPLLATFLSYKFPLSNYHMIINLMHVHDRGLAGLFCGSCLLDCAIDCTTCISVESIGIETPFGPQLPRCT